MGERTWDCEPPTLVESLTRDLSVTDGLGDPLPLKLLQNQPAREASRLPTQRSLSFRRNCRGLNAP